VKEHSSWVHVVDGKKAPPVVEIVVQTKFEEERMRQAKEQNL